MCVCVRVCVCMRVYVCEPIDTTQSGGDGPIKRTLINRFNPYNDNQFACETRPFVKSVSHLLST